MSEHIPGMDGGDKPVASTARMAGLGARLLTSCTFAGQRIADLVMPPRCLLSGEPVAAHGDLAPLVWQQLDFIDAPYCAACGLPWEAQIAGQDLCAACIAGHDHPKALTDPAGLDRIRAAMRYDDLAAKLALQLKYADRMDMAGGLSRLMARAGQELLTDESVTLIPVPLHRRRLVSRRFNQAGLLASSIGRIRERQVRLDILRRTKATAPQQGLSAKGRERNVTGAFRIDPAKREAIDGTHVILIDDVLTTGSTLKACAKVLKRAGAAQVDALVLARVVPEGIGAI